MMKGSKLNEKKKKDRSVRQRLFSSSLSTSISSKKKALCSQLCNLQICIELYTISTLWGMTELVFPILYMLEIKTILSNFLEIQLDGLMRSKRHDHSLISTQLFYTLLIFLQF